jgi:hypothetical protein
VFDVINISLSIGCQCLSILESEALSNEVSEKCQQVMVDILQKVEAFVLEP